VPDHKHDEKHDESFRVIDRRLFSAEGELRKDVAAEMEREEAKTTQAASAPQGGSKPKDQEAAAADAPQPLRAFQAVIGVLARNAELMMGGYADPRTGQPILDLEGAREMIDMLDALREKTKGNLAPEEDKLLLDVLGSLKLGFMEVSKAAAQAMREKAARKGS